MSVTVTPHLNFRGQARAALDFYRQVFGGEQVLVTYGDLGASGAAGPSAAAQRGPGTDEQIIWGQVATDDGFRIMAFDILAPRPYDAGTNAFFVSLRGRSAAKVEAWWHGLSEGATILHPLGPAVWSKLYGMLTDRFGVTWVVDLEPGAA